MKDEATNTPSPACEQCGGAVADDTPEHLCPRCLLRQALSEGPDPSEWTSPELGTHIGYLGDYELREEIGRGGMGVVYRARQKSLDREVAVKLLLAGAWAGEPAFERFRGEARAAAALRHPNLVTIYEIGEHDGQPFFSMEYVAGSNLEEQLEHGPMEPLQAVALVRTLAEAVEVAHEHGILHRDLKPSNVLIDADSQPRITDFGLAKQLRQTADAVAGGLTVTGEFLGTPGYLPPEQARAKMAPAASEVGPASDVYSLGAILYALLTGRPPFVGDSALDAVIALLEGDPTPPRQLRPSLPRDLEALCLRCLEKEPHRRYGSARELADDLGRFLAGRPIATRSLGPLGRVRRWARRRPGRAIVAALMVALTAAGLWLGPRVDYGAEGDGIFVRGFSGLLGGVADRRRQAIEHLYTEGAEPLHRLPFGRIDRQATSADGSFVAAIGHRETASQSSGSRETWSKDIEVWETASGRSLGHHSTEYSLAGLVFTPDNKRLLLLEREMIWEEQSDDLYTRFSAAGARQEILRIWDLASGEVQTQSRLATAASYVEEGELIVHPDGTNFAYRDSNGQIAIWHLAAGEVRRTQIAGFPLLFLDKRELLFRQRGRLGVWDLEHQSATTIPAEGNFLKTSADGRTALFRDPLREDSLELWNLHQRKSIGRISTNVEHSDGAAFHARGRRLALARPEAIEIWETDELQRGPRRFPLAANRSLLFGLLSVLRFSPDGGLLVAFGGEGADGRLWIWEVETGREIVEIHDQHRPLWSPDGRRLVTVGDRHLQLAPDRGFGSTNGWSDVQVGNTSVRVWQIRRPPSTYLHDRRVGRLSFHPEGHELAVDNVVYSVSCRDGHWSLAERMVVESREYLQFDAAGRLWAILARDLYKDGLGEIRQLEPEARRVELNFPTYATSGPSSRGVSGVAAWRTITFSPQSQRMMLIADLSAPQGAVSSNDQDVAELWDLALGQRLRLWQLDPRERRFEASAFQPGGEILALARSTRYRNDASVSLHDVQTGRKILDLAKSRHRFLAFSPDGKKLFSAGYGGIAVHEAASGRHLRSWSIDQPMLYGMSVAADPGPLATAGEDGTVALWDTATGAEIVRWQAHEAAVNAVAFHPDGTLLVTGGADGAIKLWNLAWMRQELAAIGLEW